MIEYKKTYKDGHYNYQYMMQDFESMTEIAMYLENIKDLSKYELTQDSLLSEEREFYGVSSYKDMHDRLKYGDSKVTSIYLDKLKSITDESEIYNEIKMDVEGYAYDMGAVVSGEPECCLNSGYPSVKPHLNIYIDTGYNGSVSPSTIANRGIAVYQLISNLLSQGYLLDIWIIHYIETSSGEYCCQRVKLSTEYLTVSQLAFGGTCEFFRVITWLLTAIQVKRHSYTGSGQSMPKSCVIDELQKTGLYIPSGYTDSRFNCCDLKQAQEYVIDIYNEYVGGKNESY